MIKSASSRQYHEGCYRAEYQLLVLGVFRKVAFILLHYDDKNLLL